jgi:hypothetical protein
MVKLKPIYKKGSDVKKKKKDKCLLFILQWRAHLLYSHYSLKKNNENRMTELL